MNIHQAYTLVANAGRELGSGPSAVIPWLAAGVRDYLRQHGVPEENAQSIALGICIGRVMAEEEHALKQLDKITDQWEKGH